MKNRSIRYLKTLLITMLLVIFTSCAGNNERPEIIGSENQAAQNSSSDDSEQEVFGMVDWETGDPKPIHMVTCGFDGHGLYTIMGRGDLFSVRVELRESDGEVDFDNPQAVILRFERDHEYGRIVYHLSGTGLNGEPTNLIGQITASLDGASGETVLPDVVGGEIDGSVLTYDFTCSHDLNRLRI